MKKLDNKNQDNTVKGNSNITFSKKNNIKRNILVGITSFILIALIGGIFMGK